MVWSLNKHQGFFGNFKLLNKQKLDLRQQIFTHGKVALWIPCQVVEQNPDDNFLSAGEMPLPALFSMMSFLFMLSAVFWFFLLKKSK